MVAARQMGARAILNGDFVDVDLMFAPGNRRRSHEGASDALVLHGLEGRDGGAKESASVQSGCAQIGNARLVCAPLLGETVQGSPTARRDQGGAGLLGSFGRRRAKAQREIDVRDTAIGQRQLAGQGHVAAGRGRVVPVLVEIRVQILPAVARADEPGGGVMQAAAREQRLGLLALPGVEAFRQIASVPEHRARGVAHRRVADTRFVEKVKVQTGHLAGDAQLLQHDVPIGIRVNRAFDFESALGIGIGHAKGRNPIFEPLRGGRGVPALFEKERRAVGDQELRVFHLRSIKSRPVDLGQHALGAGVPNARKGRGRRGRRITII